MRFREFIEGNVSDSDLLSFMKQKDDALDALPQKRDDMDDFTSGALSHAPTNTTHPDYKGKWYDDPQHVLHQEVPGMDMRRQKLSKVPGTPGAKRKTTRKPPIIRKRGGGTV